MDRLMLISADCHWGLEPARYRPYVDSKYHSDFDQWLEHGPVPAAIHAEGNRRMAAAFGVTDPPLAGEQAELAERLHEHFPDLAESEARDWIRESTNAFRPEISDPALRMKEMEADGVCAEFIIQQQGLPFFADAAQNQLDVIFDIPSNWDSISTELMMAGARAYHRAVADFVSAAPDRMIGLSTVPTLADVDRAVEELTWAAEHGLRGVLVPADEIRRGLPPLYDQRYDRFWAACVDLNMPVHWHVGASPIRYGTSKHAGTVNGFEIFFWAHRPLWLMMLGGVFGRHPGLKLVFTEQTVEWLPRALDAMDRRVEHVISSGNGLAPGNPGAPLPAKPSELWRSNCMMGASCMSREEALLAEGIGVETMMFGTDYPHQETVWPHSGAYINQVMKGLSEGDIRAMCGENAARAYGFDVEKLRPVAERIGHRMEDVLDPQGPLAREAQKYPRAGRADRFGSTL